MAKGPGRDAALFKGAIKIGGVRVSNVSIDSTPIDVTDNDSVGLQELLAESSMRVLSFDVEGIYKDAVLEDIAMDSAASQLLTDLTFKLVGTVVGLDTIAGDFFMLNYKRGFDYKEAGTFTASFTSSGEWTRA